MAMGKSSRVDGKKSSSYGLTITIVLLLSLCLVGAWMFMSSWSAPADSVDYSSSDTAKDVDTLTKNDSRKEEKNEENVAVTQNNHVKTDSEKSAEEVDESSGEKSETVEEKKESDDSNGDGDGEKEKKNVKEVESESDEANQKEKTQLEESTEENKSEDGNVNEENTSEEKSEENASEIVEAPLVQWLRPRVLIMLLHQEVWGSIPGRRDLFGDFKEILKRQVYMRSSAWSRCKRVELSCRVH